jgi:hypothetical protein
VLYGRKRFPDSLIDIFIFIERYGPSPRYCSRNCGSSVAVPDSAGLSASSAASSSGLTNTVESVIRLACACAATGSMRATLRTWCARVDADAAFPTLAEWQLDRIPRAN